MSLKIITKRCKGCGICAAFCPKKVLAVSLVAAMTLSMAACGSSSSDSSASSDDATTGSVTATESGDGAPTMLSL